MQVLLPSPVDCEADVTVCDSTPAWLPRVAGSAGAHVHSHLQLLEPAPCCRLEADQRQRFCVCAPHAHAVAVGNEQDGWQPLHFQQEQEQPPPQQSHEMPLFSGNVVLPRCKECFIATQLQPGGAWMPQLALHVGPPMQLLVALPQIDTLQEPSAGDVLLPRARKLLNALDVDGDGAASRADVLRALRRVGGRQLADQMKLPCPVRVRVHAYIHGVCIYMWSRCHRVIPCLLIMQLYLMVHSFPYDSAMHARCHILPYPTLPRPGMAAIAVLWHASPPSAAMGTAVQD